MKPVVTIEPFGRAWTVTCEECGLVKQIATEALAKSERRDHLRWTHPTEEQAEQDRLIQFEYGDEMKGHCDRCGQAGHEGKACPTIQPYLLKSGDS